MSLLAFTWTDIWLGIGKAFQWVFPLLPKIGFFVNFLIWIIIAYWFFYWVIKQSKDTKRAKAEGRLI